MLQQKKQISRALAGTGDGGLQEEEAAEQEQQRGMRSRALQLRAMQDQQLEELKLSILADRRVPPLRSDAPPGTRGQLFSAEPADLTWRESRSLSTWQYRAVHTCLHQLGLGEPFWVDAGIGTGWRERGCAGKLRLTWKLPKPRWPVVPCAAHRLCCRDLSCPIRDAQTKVCSDTINLCSCASRPALATVQMWPESSQLSIHLIQIFQLQDRPVMMMSQAQEVRRKAQLANEATRDANLVLKALKAEEKHRERLADQATAGDLQNPPIGCAG